MARFRWSLAFISSLAGAGAFAAPLTERQIERYGSSLSRAIDTRLTCNGRDGTAPFEGESAEIRARSRSMTRQGAQLRAAVNGNTAGLATTASEVLLVRVLTTDQAGSGSVTGTAELIAQGAEVKVRAAVADGASAEVRDRHLTNAVTELQALIRYLRAKDSAAELSNATGSSAAMSEVERRAVADKVKSARRRAEGLLSRIRSFRHALACRSAERSINRIVHRVERSIPDPDSEAILVMTIDAADPLIYDGIRCVSIYEMAAGLRGMNLIGDAQNVLLETLSSQASAVVAQVAVAYIRRHGERRGDHRGRLTDAERTELTAILNDLIRRFAAGVAAPQSEADDASSVADAHGETGTGTDSDED